MEKKVVLKESPLVIALAAIRYTEIPEFDKLNVDAVFAGLVKLGFKYKKSVLDSTIDLSTPHLLDTSLLAPQHMSVSQKQIWRHVFISLDRKWSVHLTKEQFILKTSGYETFEAFAEKAEKVLETLVKLVPSFSDVGFLTIGLRYVDLILPKKGKELASYLKPKFEQPDWNGILNSKAVSRSRLTSLVTTSIGNLRVDLVELFPGPNGECELIPPELGDAPETELNLTIRDWWVESLQAKQHYAILDIDHSKELAESYNISSIMQHLTSLYQPAKQAFLAVVSEEALAEWKQEKIEQ